VDKTGEMPEPHIPNDDGTAPLPRGDTGDTAVAHVAEIWRYPVKSMQGERLGAARVTHHGIDGDRAYALRDVESGKVLSAKRWGRLLEGAARLVEGRPAITLPGGNELAWGDPGTDAALSEWFGRPVQLVRADPSSPATYQLNVDPLDPHSAILDIQCPPDTFHDAAATHLVTTASLAAARSLLPSSAWDVRRFRPVIVLEVPGAAFVEDGWIGPDLRIGEALLSPFSPTVRCAMPARAQPARAQSAHDGGSQAIARDKAIIRALADHHNTSLGIYASVKEPGRICVGDAAELVFS
jgi:uncharacterized protein YcbX